MQRNESLHFHPNGNAEMLVYSKSTPDFANTILVAVNLDPRSEQITMTNLDLEKLGLEPDASFEVEDLLTGARYAWRGSSNYVALRPEVTAHVLRVVR